MMTVRGRRGGPRVQYKVRTRAAYDRALVGWGDVTVWVSPEAVAGWRGSAGRRTFSNAAIAAALIVRAAYRLALRAGGRPNPVDLRPSWPCLAGAGPYDLVPPSRTLRLNPRACAGGGLDLAIDSTGLPLAKPSGAGHEGWRELHIAVDTGTRQILAKELTRSDRHNTVPVPALLDRVTGRIGRVYGDGTYAGGPTYHAMAEHRQALPTPRANSDQVEPTDRSNLLDQATG